MTSIQLLGIIIVILLKIHDFFVWYFINIIIPIDNERWVDNVIENIEN
jgi:hypothetical protein